MNQNETVLSFNLSFRYFTNDYSPRDLAFRISSVISSLATDLVAML